MVCLLAVACGSEEAAPRSDADKRERIEALYRRYKRSFPETPEVTVDELLAMRGREETVIVDGREGAEREVSMIPGAISLEEFERGIDEHKDRAVVVYCTIGYRSGLVTKSLHERGLRAYNLRGGILAWLDAGQEVADAEGETRRVHVYGSKWDLAPEGYETVW